MALSEVCLTNEALKNCTVSFGPIRIKKILTISDLGQN